MRRFLVICILMVQIAAFTGCAQLMKNRVEIDKIFNTRIIGIDKLDTDKVLYTLTTKTGVAAKPEQAMNSKITDVLVSEGTTVFDAARNMLKYGHKKPHYGHTEFILFGEKTAKDGIIPYLDFISRNQEFRYNAKIYIIKQETANAFISKANTGGLFLADKISIIEDNAYALSLSSKVTLTEALYIFTKPDIATFLPVLRLSPSKSGEGPTEGNFDMLLEGYAIFKADKLVALLDNSYSRGINWIMNRIESGILLVKAPDNQIVSMEIIDSKTTIIPYMDDQGLQCTINIKFNTNIAETLSKVAIFNQEGFNYIKKQQEAEIKKEVEAILQYAQKNNLDIFGIVTKFRIKYPLLKEDFEKNWKELFPQIKFNVQVESKINRTYLIRDPGYAK